MPLAKIRSPFVRREHENADSSLLPHSSTIQGPSFQEGGNNAENVAAPISSTSSSPTNSANFRSIFRIKRSKQQNEDGEGAGASEETLKISDNSNALGRHPPHSSSADFFAFFTIPCFLLCLLSILFVILLLLITGYHLGKYMRAANDSMNELRGEEELAAIAGWHLGGMQKGKTYSEDLDAAKGNKTENEKLSGIVPLANGNPSPLHFAAEKGDFELVKLLIENGVNAKAKDGKGWTPLHYGALNGRRQISLFLLKYWRENGDERELESILEEMKGMKVPGNEGEGIRGDLEGALAELKAKKNGPRLEVPIGFAQLKLQEYIHLGQMRRENEHQIWGDLLRAAKHGKGDLVRTLLDQGADINAIRNGYGNSALHLAATYGHLEAVKLLLERGADVGARNTKQQTALYYAACEGKEQVVSLLIESGAEVNARGKDGNSPLHCAAEEGWARIEQILIGKGAEVNAKNGRGYTPLHWAAQYGKAEASATLLANGADVKAKVTKNAVTALHLAAQEGHKHILELLLEKGANLEEGDRFGWTALHYAIRNGRIGCVKMLLDKWNGHNEGPSLLALIDREDSQIKEMMMRKLFHSR